MSLLSRLDIAQMFFEEGYACGYSSVFGNGILSGSEVKEEEEGEEMGGPDGKIGQSVS